ncbi:MAG: hypothetical protein HFJ10_12795 [Lachnospiraceae bacterium]|nr:hypothetical protein [Lachnospiraceae bacterium]
MEDKEKIYSDSKIGYQSPVGVDLGVWGLKCHLEREFSNQSVHYELDSRLHVQKQDIILEKHVPKSVEAGLARSRKRE